MGKLALVPKFSSDHEQTSSVPLHTHIHTMYIHLTADTCKYFGCELGAQTQMSGGRYIVNGAHEGSKLQELLDGFIRRFVLCSECENPETDLVGHS